MATSELPPGVKPILADEPADMSQITVRLNASLYLLDRHNLGRHSIGR
jgi:hypothetical protein